LSWHHFVAIAGDADGAAAEAALIAAAGHRAAAPGARAALAQLERLAGD
jgi:hypothetical protein